MNTRNCYVPAIELICERFAFYEETWRPVGTSTNLFRSRKDALEALIRWNSHKHYRYCLVDIQETQYEYGNQRYISHPDTGEIIFV